MFGAVRRFVIIRYLTHFPALSKVTNITSVIPVTSIMCQCRVCVQNHLKAKKLVLSCWKHYVDFHGEKREDNIREWTGLEFTKSQRAVENREQWRKLVVKSSVVPKVGEGES